MSEGRIFNIAHFAVHDGPGIRTTVFFKGCPARCLWCCSPQSQNFEIEYSKDKKKIFGRVVSAKALFAEVYRDAPFWRRSRGGVTLSGGEVMAQPEFAIEFLDICHRYGVHTAIESSLLVSHEISAMIVDKVDFVQFDMKAMDDGLHRELTGLSNKIALENAANILKSSKPALVRFPLIPGINDSEANIRAMGEFIESYRASASVEILKYHRLGTGHYEELGRSYTLPEVLPPTDEEYKRVADLLSEYNVSVI